MWPHPKTTKSSEFKGKSPWHPCRIAYQKQTWIEKCIFTAVGLSSRRAFDPLSSGKWRGWASFKDAARLEVLVTCLLSVSSRDRFRSFSAGLATDTYLVLTQRKWSSLLFRIEKLKKKCSAKTSLFMSAKSKACLFMRKKVSTKESIAVCTWILNIGPFSGPSTGLPSISLIALSSSCVAKISSVTRMIT